MQLNLYAIDFISEYKTSKIEMVGWKNSIKFIEYSEDKKPGKNN
jgi:hypothetical protein